MNRYLIAIDSNGKVYVRRTLSVVHHGESGEITYTAKPTKSFPKEIRETVRELKNSLDKTK